MWGFPVCAVVVIVLAAVLGAAMVLVLAPIIVWTFVLYIRCTRDAIKGERRGKP